MEFWREGLKEHDCILYLPMSSGLSGSCNTAMMLAQDEEFEGKVFVVDNGRVSTPLVRAIMDAIEMVEEGLSAEKIKEILEAHKLEASIYITVDTLHYLKKGGRVTPAAAMIGTILKIKPILQIHGDKLDKFALPRNMLKAKEIMKEAVKKDLENIYSDYLANGELELCVANTNNEAQAEIFLKEVQTAFPNIPVRFCEPLSLSISCHTGPGALGISVTRIVK